MNLDNMLLAIEELKKCEAELADLFKNNQVNGPMHLSGGNEEELVKIFRNVRKEDWVFSTHRNHYHALLKGVPYEWLKKEIMEGRSMHIENSEYNFVTSSIVGGVTPIALGTALGLKLKKSSAHVYLFTGDMAGETGGFSEATKYAARNDLPITFVIEDNGVSVDTPTQKSWGLSEGQPRIIKYTYRSPYPHQGIGRTTGF